jgi:tetratricopeptide (TPR) repeat protein
MRSRILVACVLLLVAALPALAAKTAGEYVAEAQALAAGGKLAEAITLLQQGAKEHPQSVDIHAYLGLYTGQTAGQTTNYVEAGRLVTESFALLDKAVELGPENPTGYFYRGMMAARVPVFLGKLPFAISDLKTVIALNEKSKGAVPAEMLVPAYSALGGAYEAAGNPVDARATYEALVKIAPGSDAATKAGERLAALAAAAPKERPKALLAQSGDSAGIAALKKRIEAEPASAKPILDLAGALLAAGRFEEAREAINAHNAIDASNADAYRILFAAVSAIAQQGYDARIAGDTNFRTNLAFESMSAAEKVVELDPNDVEARLQRGVVGVAMPFFVGKFDQGVADLEYVLKNTASPEDSAEAMYWLGAARERQAMRFWLDVATKYPDSDAAALAMASMKPVVARPDLSKQPRPFATIDFVLGFRDELAPQVAVWIEDASGAHVKTVFVSGFAGHVKGKQVTLPVWAEMSKFAGADAVTGASIDVGHYVYAWDCTGLDGKPVKPGRYTAKVEVSHWPSMKYQLAEAAFTVGKKEETARVERGDYVPSLVVTYYPR